MPPVSQAQRRFFRWAEKHPKESGVAKSVSTEMNAADKGGKLPERKSDQDRMNSRYGGKKGKGS